MNEPAAVDLYLYVIVALLPLSASMLIFQANPYHALVLRGVLGAVSALIYALLGAADVALTEALVGTMLAVTLNAVAVRSSMVLRLGILNGHNNQSVHASKLEAARTAMPTSSFNILLNNLRTAFSKHHMRIELVAYADPQDLHQALMDKDVHAICIPASPLKGAGLAHADREPLNPEPSDREPEPPPYHLITRLRRLYDIMNTELASPSPTLTLVSAPASPSATHATPVSIQPLEEQQS